MTPDDLNKLAGTRVLVLGDLMLDRYWWGDVRRISPEAPVPVVRLTKSSLAPGGAANVAINVAGLTAKPLLIGTVGDDLEKALLTRSLEERGVSAEHVVEIPGRHTTVKTRVIAHHQQVTRVDQEVDDPIDSESAGRVIDKFNELVDKAEIVVLSDYAKGILSDTVISEVMNICRTKGRSVLVDPKGKDYRKYRGATLITPNQKEACEACNIDEFGPDVVGRAGGALLATRTADAVLITQGENGMTLFREGYSAQHFTAVARDVYDVTGAGDTVISTLATALGAGLDLASATDLANIGAGIVVEQVGTTSITLAGLRSALTDRVSAKGLGS